MLEVARVDELSQEFDGLGQFDFGASGQLLLFVFLSSLTGAATLIQARRLHVVSRMLAGPRIDAAGGGRRDRRSVGDRLLPGCLHHARLDTAVRRRTGATSGCRCSCCCCSAWSLRERRCCSARRWRTKAPRTVSASVSGSCWRRSAGRCSRSSCSPTPCGTSRSSPALLGLRGLRRDPAPQRHPGRHRDSTRGAGRDGRRSGAARRLVVTPQPVPADVTGTGIAASAAAQARRRIMKRWLAAAT